MRFEELVKKYYGKPINFVLHKNSSLGLEKQYFEYMAQGKAVDYGIVSPRICRPSPGRPRSSMRRSCSATSTTGTRCSTPTSWRPSPTKIAKKADVMLIGYAGGGVRNIFINKPMGLVGRDKGAQGARSGRADLEPHLPGGRHGADGDRLQRGLQRHPEQRHQRRRERGRRGGIDEVLRGGAPPGPDRACHHHPPDLLLGQDLQGPSGRPAAGHRQSRQRGGSVRAAGRVVRGRPEARSAGEGRQAEARPLQGSRRDGQAGGAGDRGLRQGDRADGILAKIHAVK